ncbi:MAG: YpdA family putative bacillithiol disulfide reductase [Bacteroidetes bacterium]|jgi:thioredoxin reductase (NADPH)|nr:YpdA family putative bacillithiol disulfide reductase [Bacteroidota bacterium]
MRDVVIIGAGPVGLACAIEAKRRDLDALVIEKGALVNSFLGYPTNMEFFSTPELMEIGGHPFPTKGYKPTREEGIEYYRRVAEAEALDVRLYERVTAVRGQDEDFTVATDAGAYPCRKVIIAAGFFDVPNRLDVPGEDLPKVKHYFKEPFPYTGQRVLVIGGRNSAAKAALSCYRHGAHVTLAVRSDALSDKIKYWLKPDLENRIKEGSIAAHFNATVRAIEPEQVTLDTPEGPRTIPNDWVLAMTGYRPDYEFLHALGIEVRDDETRTPVHDSETFETNRAGMYLAGTICGGLNTSRWFIENGRFHAEQIAEHIAKGRVTPHELESTHWKTAE